MPLNPWRTYSAGHMPHSTPPWLRSKGTPGAFADALPAKINLRQRQTRASSVICTFISGVGQGSQAASSLVHTARRTELFSLNDASATGLVQQQGLR